MTDPTTHQPPESHVDGEATFTAAMQAQTVDAYVSELFGSPAAVRSNAQNGFAIASAVAAAIVAAGIFGGVLESGLLLQILTVAALVGWLAAAWVFLRAVSRQPTLERAPHRGPAREFVDGAMKEVWQERDIIAKTSWRAQRITFAAGILTLLAAGTAIFLENERAIDAHIALSSEGRAQLASICDGVTEVWGEVQLDTLGDQFVTIALDAGVCDGEEATVRVPRRAITSIRERE